MNEPHKMPTIEDGDILCQSMQTGKAWVPLEIAGDIHGELATAKKLMMEAYECLKRLELSIQGKPCR